MICVSRCAVWARLTEEPISMTVEAADVSPEEPAEAPTHPGSVRRPDRLLQLDTDRLALI